MATPPATACVRCGSPRPADARFCPSCGQPVAQPAAAERKVVTVLFVDLVGSTASGDRTDPEDIMARLSRYHACVRTELERYGGTLEKFIGDAVVALFGAPAAHEDDPERAVRAAFAVLDAIHDLNETDPSLGLQVRIGIETGDAVIAIGARAADGESLAAGDVLNTCSRLQAAAATNGILVGPGTYRATERAIEYREVEPLAAKGKSEPLPVWEPIAPRSGVGRAVRFGAPLVGRVSELSLLLNALERARRDRAPQLVTLIGVPGIGKSRLVAELIAAVEGSVSCHTGRSLPYGDGVPFSAVADMVKIEAGILESDDSGTVQAKLQRSLADALAGTDDGDWVESNVRPLVGLEGYAQPAGDLVEAFAAWRRFFEALAEREPHVLVFEDLHWANEGLLEFVEHLVEWAAPVPLLVVCTARPELLERRPRWSGGRTNALTLALSPLTDEETEHLVRALLGESTGGVEPTLVAFAGGNPLYAEEYVRMVVDRDDAVAGALPETVQGMIAARIDLLPADEKGLLQDAAAIGERFWAGATATLGDRSPEATGSLLHTLERKEFVRREGRSSVAGESEFRFRHVLLRDVAYSQIPRARRAEKHRIAAEWLERLAEGREDQAELLAHHYRSALAFARASGLSGAGVAGRARIALRDAGDRAARLNEFATAARHFREALDLWPEDGRSRALVLLALGRALAHAEEGGAEALEEAYDALRAAGENEAAAEAATLLSALVRGQGRREAADEYLRRAEELLDDRPTPAKASLLAGLASSLLFADRFDEAIDAGRRALAMAEQLGLAELQARALATIGTARWLPGDAAGIADLERSVAVATEANSPEAVRSNLHLAGAYTELADVRRAAAHLEEARRGAERFGLAGRLRWCRGARVDALFFSGDWDAAVRAADEFLTESAATGGHYLDSFCRIYRGHVRLARGDLGGGFADAVEALRAARVTGDSQLVVPALAYSAVAELAAGHGAAAGRLVDELLALWDGSGARFALARWGIDLAAVLADLGRGAELRARAAGAGSRTRWFDAAEAIIAGDFARATALFTEIGTVPDTMLARLVDAERLAAAGLGAQGAEEAAPAAEFFRGVGARAFEQRLDALLASVG